jgi:hypothetical protein
MSVYVSIVHVWNAWLGDPILYGRNSRLWAKVLIDAVYSSDY